MPYVRVKPIGAGTPADPWRCPLPTYRFVADLGAVSGWIVEVRDEDVPDGATVTSIAVPTVGVVNVVTGLNAAQLAAWKGKLDSRYPSRDKAVDPNVA